MKLKRSTASFRSGSARRRLRAAIEAMEPRLLLSTGSITGTIYNDANDNGARDTGEAAHPNESSVVARYFPDGSPDKTFGTNGEIVEQVANSSSEAHDVLVEPDGRIIVVGQDQIGPNDTGYYERFFADGTEDPSFRN